MSLIISILATYLAIKLLYPVAVRIRLVDCPNERKIHTGSIPLIGGVSMFLGFAISLLLSATDLNEMRGLLIASLLVVIVGAFDDFFDISFKKRMVLQIAAVLMMTSLSGVVLINLGDLGGTGVINLSDWAVPFTVFAALGVMNAVNMIDGVDGLAGLTSLISFISVIVLYLLGNETDIKLLMFIGALIPFLWFNLSSKQKIFMGDAGSMFLGLGIAWVLIESSQGDQAVMAPVTALWLVSVPLIDTVAIMCRRILKGQSPFKPDREHIHHIFQRAGYSDRAILIIMGITASIMSFIGIIGFIAGVPEWFMLALFLSVFALYFWGIQHAWVLLKFLKKT